MSTEQNKAMIRRYVEEIWSSGSLEAADEIMAEPFRHHTRKRERPLQPPGVNKEKSLSYDNRIV